MLIDSFKVEDWFNKYEKQAKYDLADTCIESLSINDLLKICEIPYSYLNKIFDKKLNYGDIHGSQNLKLGICSLYENQNPENITITHGAIGANQLVMLSLVEPNDKIVSIVPTYQQHYSIPKSFGGNVHLYFLKEENNWLPDLSELERLVGSDTKLICMNNPNNPTGSIIPDEMLEQIVQIAQKSGAYILCDEVYRGLKHKGNPFSKSIVDMYEKGISTGSMSKVFSLAGLRLGWVCASKQIINDINLQREYNTISIGILDDYFASLALENKDKIIARNLEKLYIGKKILVDWINSEPNVDCIVPEAGTTAFVKYLLPIKSVNLCRNLQNETGVMLLPGETLEIDGYVRVGYGNNFEQLKRGLEIFSYWMKNQK
ncbi:aminotransferase [bacterium]|nr:aminotransferase [bacterium]